MVREVESDPESVSGTGSPRKVKHFKAPPLAHAYHVWWTSVATAIVRPLPLTE